MLWIVLAAALAAETVPSVPMKTLDEIRIRDPFVLSVEERGTYFLYGTGRPLGKPGFDAYKSRDLKAWEGPFPVFRPEEDYWGQRDFWAPEVFLYRGRYYLFGTFSPADKGPRGTAILVADAPEGPFMPHSKGPVTPPDWYALDGTLFIDGEDKPWMVFCHEWVQIGDGAICAVRLSEDLSRAEGEPATLFHASDAPWGTESEFHGKPGRVTDGPWLHRGPDGSLWMLWSSFGKGGAYTVGSARSTTGKITGPWQVQATPVFADNGGHPMLFPTFDGKLVMAIHQPNSRPKERARLFEMAVDADGFELRGSLTGPLR